MAAASNARHNAEAIAPVATRATPAAAMNVSSAANGDGYEAPRRWLTPMRATLPLILGAAWLGYKLPTERYISPELGLGYALGIVGGSMMLLLLLYPLRKRLAWLGALGSVRVWFEAHIVLGLLGPLLVLYHSNFSLGAPNSNAALIAMLLVATSGLFGRHFYTRVHSGLHGRRLTRQDMQNAAAEMRQKVSGSKFVPDLLEMLDAAEARMLTTGPSGLLLPLRPIALGVKMHVERWRITRRALAELRAAAHQSRVLQQQQRHFATTVRSYIRKRLRSTREVAEFEAYDRLFSLWHMLHLPMYVLLIIAGVVHVIAVHVY
jgi:hypothetical protein